MRSCRQSASHDAVSHPPGPLCRRAARHLERRAAQRRRPTVVDHRHDHRLEHRRSAVCAGAAAAAGARLSAKASAYAAWLFLLDGIPLPFIFLGLRGRGALWASAAETAKAAAGGVISLVAYGVVIWAVTLGPMGPVSALRETSVVFAALIGRYFLSETLTVRRLGACAVIALGAICLGYHP